MTEILTMQDRPFIPDIPKAEGYYGYQVVTLSLAAAQTNRVIEVPGNFVQVFGLTTGASVQLSFNAPGNNLNFDGEQHMFIHFTRIYVTNTAQAGATVSIFIGNGVYYIPYYRTAQISPSVKLVKQYSINSGAAATLFSAAYGADFTGYSVTRIDMVNDVLGNTVYLGNAGVTAADGFPIVAGQFYSMALTPHYLAAPLYHIAPVASTLKIIVYGVQ